jgi:4-amino-4-deoxy-L-arabinose transferase-like glycosyltransferase
MSVGTASPIAPRRAGIGTARQTGSLVRPAWIAVAALTVLAAGIRFYRLGHQGFWFDEATTALLVHFSPGKMLGQIPYSESTPPLYYCIAWVWARIFGYGETGLRSLSAAAGVLTVPVAYAAASRLISVRAGLIAAALTACNPLLIWYSQEARSYQLLVLLSATSVLAFAYLLERPSARYAALWVIASALALATHYYAILAVVPEGLWLLYVHRRSRAVQVALGIIVLCGLALIPLAISQHGNGRSNWIAKTSLALRVKQIVPQFVIGFGSPAYGVLEPLALALAVFGVVLLITRTTMPERRGAMLAGGLALGGLVLNLLLIAAGVDDLLTRNVLAIWVPAAIALSGGFAASRARLVGAAAATALCVIGLVAAVGVARDRNLQRPDWRGVAALLGARPSGAAAIGGRAIVVQNYKDLLPLKLYLPGLAFVPHHRTRVSELDVVSFTDPRGGGLCWWGSACNLIPSQMQSSYPIPGFRPVWRRHVYQFTVLHMVAVDGPTLVRAGQIAGILTNTTMHRSELMVQR